MSSYPILRAIPIKFNEGAVLIVCGFGVLTCTLLLAIEIEGTLDMAAFLTPIILFCNSIAITCIGRSNGRLLSILWAGLIAKLIAAWVYAKMFLSTADVGFYFDQGRALADTSTYTRDLFQLRPLWGTNFISTITACIFSVCGSSLMIAMVLFALASYWAQYLYYRAYCCSFSAQARNSAAAMLFLWPSVIFWPATLGKDALVSLSIALTVYGCVTLSRTKKLGPCLLMSLGISSTLIIKPHIALLLAIAMVIAYGFSVLRQGAKLSLEKPIILCGLLLSTIPVGYVCAQLFQVSDTGEVVELSDRYFEGNQSGGSTFDADRPFAERLVLAPLLLVRPFPWEINGAPAALASMEGLALLWVAFAHGKRLLRLIRNARMNRLALFAIVFSLLCTGLFAATFSNFGLLARQRVMVIPSILILLAASTRNQIARRYGKTGIRDPHLPIVQFEG